MLKEIRLFKRRMLEKRENLLWLQRTSKIQATQAIQKKGKTCYNSGNKGHCKRECMFFLKIKAIRS